MHVTCIPNPLVDVDGEDGGARVEHGGEGGHQSGEHHRHQEAAQTNLSFMNEIQVCRAISKVQFLLGVSSSPA